MAKATYKTDVVWTGENIKSVARANGHDFVIDEPKSLGGTDEGPNPVEYLLASLGGCLNVIIAMLAPRYDVELKGVVTKVEGDLDPDGFMEVAPVRTGFDAIRYKIEIDTDAPAEQVEKLIAHTEKLCPVKDTLTGVEMTRV